MEKKKIRLSIVMPVLNEGINLKIMLKILEATIDVPHEVIVVYDSIKDNSIPVVNQIKKKYPSIKGVHNKLGKGVINAIKKGVSASKGKYILILSADDIGPVLAVEDMLYLMDNGCEIVSATRYAYGGRIMGGFFISRLLSRIANKLFNLISRSSLTDLTIGIKMFKPSIFDKIKLESKPVGWAVAFEMAIKSQIYGLKLGEVPIISINRFYGGKSSFKLGPWVIEYSKWFLWGLSKIYFSGKWRRKISVKIPEKIRSRRNK